ncbi:hypothetical protein [Glycomyces tarimensis]
MANTPKPERKIAKRIQTDIRQGAKSKQAHREFSQKVPEAKKAGQMARLFPKPKGGVIK